MKCALICGISGQDGSYLAKHLLDKGYRVCGTSRDSEMSGFSNLQKLSIRDQVELYSMSLIDFRSVVSTLSKVEPDEIYNLAGQTSVGLSFNQPVEALESITVGTLNLLEAMRFRGKACRFYNAGSSEIFGDLGGECAATEKTAFRPRSPYGVAKSAAHWIVANYREAYGLYACSGILFNHESPLRPDRFVTSKIVSTACRIASGSPEKLRLGRIDIVRDWGWAPEYVEAMALMLQRENAADYVIATGKSVSLQRFVELVFLELNLDWLDHVESDASLFRATDIADSRADPSRAEIELDWSAKTKIERVVSQLVSAECMQIF